jgi:hypothetical protein
MVRVREPNMGLLHGLIPDGPLDGLIRATNHALRDGVGGSEKQRWGGAQGRREREASGWSGGGRG